MNGNEKFFSDFNKEIVYGEIGAILGAAILASIVSLFTSNRVRIAQFTVLGSILGGATLFLFKKVRNKIRNGDPILKSILHDLKFFTPAAVVIMFGIGYPALYYLMKYLTKVGWNGFVAGAVSELVGFVIFIVCINLYKFGVFKIFHKSIMFHRNGYRN